jgi:hypothetical protein
MLTLKFAPGVDKKTNHLFTLQMLGVYRWLYNRVGKTKVISSQMYPGLIQGVRILHISTDTSYQYFRVSFMRPLPIRNV